MPQLFPPRRPMAAVHAPPTPIGDRLYDITGGETLATWNRHRGRKRHGRGPRVYGGEWDTLRSTPLRVRQSLTAAGYLSAGGMLPDDFADLLRRHGGVQVGPDPIAWYLAEARRALAEARAARRVGADVARARAAGHPTAFAYRDAQARAAGHRSYRGMRAARGWPG